MGGEWEREEEKRLGRKEGGGKEGVWEESGRERKMNTWSLVVCNLSGIFLVLL